MDHLLTHPRIVAESAPPRTHPGAGDPALVLSPVRVEPLWGPDALRELQPIWNPLVAASRMEHPFATHEWISSWWEAFGHGSSLAVFVARAGGVVTGIAPMMPAHGPGRRWLAPRWRSLHNAHTPRLDWVVGHRHDDSYAALWTAVRPRAWTGRLDIGALPDGSPTLPAISDLARRDGLLVGVRPGAWSPRVTTECGWDHYVASLSAHHRKNMRARLSQLSRLGPVALETVTGGADLAGALERGFWLESAAWKRTNGTAILSTPAVTTFYTRLAERAAAQGWLRLLFLTIGGRRVAFAFGLLYRDRLSLLKIGYDPEYARHSPGQVLFWTVIRDACASSIREVDLLGTDDPWKREWTGQGRRQFGLTVLPNCLLGRTEYAVQFDALPIVRQSALWSRCRAAARPHILTTAARRPHGH